MKTLIFEGIATSGKSTVIESIVKSLSGKMRVEVAEEEQTHEPIMAKRNELHERFFKELINRLALRHPDLLIFDRLYITQAYRNGSDLSEYSSVEEALLPYAPRTIILKVDEEHIADRVKAAAEHRDQEWRDYLKTKGDSFEEIAQDYINQQRGLLSLVKQSKIPYTIFDTTTRDYEKTTKQILKIIRK